MAAGVADAGQGVVFGEQAHDAAAGRAEFGGVSGLDAVRATVNFEASPSAAGGPDGATTSYTWNFGDGSAVADGGGSADASHTFESPGTYTVTLTTTDDLGVSTTTTEQITVSAPTPPGVITVTPSPPVQTPPPSTGPTAPTPQPLTAGLAAAKKQRLAAVTAHGLRIQLSTNASSTVSFQITVPRSETRQGAGPGRTQRLNRKPLVLLQTGGRSFGAGTYTIMLKLSKAAVRELSGAGPLQVTIRMTVVGPHGARLTRSASITLQR